MVSSCKIPIGLVSRHIADIATPRRGRRDARIVALLIHCGRACAFNPDASKRLAQSSRFHPTRWNRTAEAVVEHNMRGPVMKPSTCRVAAATTGEQVTHDCSSSAALPPDGRGIQSAARSLLRSLRDRRDHRARSSAADEGWRRLQRACSRIVHSRCQDGRSKRQGNVAGEIDCPTAGGTSFR